MFRSPERESIYQSDQYREFLGSSHLSGDDGVRDGFRLRYELHGHDMIAYDSISSMIQPAVDKDTISLIRMLYFKDNKIDRSVEEARYIILHTYIHICIY
jgi:hypothetical protein